METAIKIFIVFPKRRDRWKYYINDNLQDSHVLHRDKIQQFILQYINAEAGNQVIWHLNKYHAFIVYVEQNQVYRLEADKEKALENMRRDFNKKVFSADRVYKEVKKEAEKDNHDMFISNNNNMLKKLLK